MEHAEGAAEERHDYSPGLKILQVLKNESFPGFYTKINLHIESSPGFYTNNNKQ